MLEHDEVVRRLGYHPATEVTGPAFEVNRSAAILLAELWNQALPAGREAALAQTALQESLMWANAAIATGTGPDWQRPAVDVSELVDDLLERLEGPLQIRTAAEVVEPATIGPDSGQCPVCGGLVARILLLGHLRAHDLDDEAVRVVVGDCTSWTSVTPSSDVRCELVAGHEGDHRRGSRWAWR